MIRAYHFVDTTLRDGSPIPADGKWLSIAPPLRMCSHGLHASRHPFDALAYAPGNTLCLVDCDGKIIEHKDKLVAERRRIVARFDAEPFLREFARSCALDVTHLWKAPPVVRSYLVEGDESSRPAAWAAAWDAAQDAAQDAAREAAWAAAWAAARAAAQDAAWAAAQDAAWAAAWAAAQDAAQAAAQAAAQDAAWAAAWAAARAAAQDAQKNLFADAVYAEFIALGVEP